MTQKASPASSTVSDASREKYDFTRAPKANTRRRFEYSVLEMRARALKNALVRLARLRRMEGKKIGDPASWAFLIANLVAAISGANASIVKTRGLCLQLFIYIPDELLLGPLNDACRLRADRGDSFALPPPAMVGQLVGLLSTERARLQETFPWTEEKPSRGSSGPQRRVRIPIDAIDETVEDRRRNRDRERKARERARAGARPRETSLEALAPWEALGMGRSTYFARGLHRIEPDSNVRVTLDKGKADEPVQGPGKGDETVRRKEAKKQDATGP